jgi:small GTP-binding protein
MSADKKTVIAIAGNPNSGKTTMFNALTGSHQRVGNWPGVTVEKKSGSMAIGGAQAEVVDLPGIYSLSSHSEDERVARDYLLSREANLVVNIVDASNLERNLFLTLNLLEMRVPVILVLNMMDLAAKRGMKVDPDALSAALGVPVVPISAIKRGDIGRLKDRLPALLESGKALDTVVLNRYLGIPVFLGVMYLLFWFVINVGGAFIDFFDSAFGAVFVDGFSLLLDGIGSPAWLVALLAGGIGAGIQTVATFVPIMFMMFFMLALLEDSGYMSRAAFVMDRALRAIGLPGKAFIPMIVGFGCSVPAIMATRTLENKRDRYLTVFMVPFMSCGARLPVYALFGAAFFPRNGGLIVLSLYLTGIVLAVATAFMQKSTLFRGEPSPFVMELPPLSCAEARRPAQARMAAPESLHVQGRQGDSHNGNLARRSQFHRYRRQLRQRGFRELGAFCRGQGHYTGIFPDGHRAGQLAGHGRPLYRPLRQGSGRRDAERPLPSRRVRIPAVHPHIFPLPRGARRTGTRNGPVLRLGIGDIPDRPRLDNGYPVLSDSVGRASVVDSRGVGVARRGHSGFLPATSQRSSRHRALGELIVRCIAHQVRDDSPDDW